MTPKTPRGRFAPSPSSSYVWRATYAWSGEPPICSDDIKRIFQRDDGGECAEVECECGPRPRQLEHRT
jgi:hypothetical protein